MSSCINETGNILRMWNKTDQYTMTEGLVNKHTFVKVVPKTFSAFKTEEALREGFRKSYFLGVSIQIVYLTSKRIIQQKRKLCRLEVN